MHLGIMPGFCWMRVAKAAEEVQGRRALVCRCVVQVCFGLDDVCGLHANQYAADATLSSNFLL